jgi:hypothetical protein
MRSTIRWGALAALTALAASCSERRIDCFDICVHVEACTVVNIDVTQCTDLCVAYARQSAANEVQAEACNDCLDDFSCGSCRGICDFVIAPIE